MFQIKRREALLTLPALALAGCGGGGAGSDIAESAAQAAAGVATETAKESVSSLSSPAATPAQFLLWDAGSGPSRDYWNVHLQLPWKNRNVGDWLDAAGVGQGAQPWAGFVVKALGPVTVDITALAARWVGTGENRGAFLRGSGVSASAFATWAGRLSATPPQLLVRTEQGEFACAGLVATLNPSTYRNLDTRQSAWHTARTPVMVQFDLSAVRGTVQQALMTLTCVDRDVRYAFNVGVFEVDAPRFQLGADAQASRMGIAAGGDAALRAHPAVLRMGDFSNLTRSGLFDELSFDSRNPYELLADPDAPGTVMFRGTLTPNANLSFNGVSQLLRGNPADPLRPALPALYEELYARLYIYLEPDWDSSVDINKMALGWDLRLGWWNDYAGGYWYSITGNGGRRGTGKRLFWPKGSSGAVQLYDRWGYEGHSVRMVAGLDPGDGSPYAELRPLQDYIYSLDQASDFGEVERLGNAVISKGRWHCLEQRIRINSVDSSLTDEWGNGEANPDGEIDTWLDGVLVAQRRGLRWRCHPEIGLRGPWINWYFGGRTRPTSTMHYRMNHFALATEYIGPRVG
ncbi:hypothetical protein [Azohydromonas lata]|uniref:Uncharacterized protein n=1 Tax=Azohydromonas lata TaxID=45677 RepID=A0ABU5IRD6_9BURK|nr:hypothetical protein [Azohydromonas lata]MDZ5461446.1 hypothetical protein [Azohydromonas lata]